MLLSISLVVAKLVDTHYRNYSDMQSCIIFIKYDDFLSYNGKYSIWPPVFLLFDFLATFELIGNTYLLVVANLNYYN